MDTFFIFGVWFFIFGSVVRVFLVLYFSLFSGFFFSVTLPGTYAPHSAVTRGKPSLFRFPRFQGSFEPTFWFLQDTSFRPSLKCPIWFFLLLFGFLCGFCFLVSP